MYRILTTVFAGLALGLGLFAWHVRTQVHELRDQITLLQSQKEADAKARQTAEQSIQPLKAEKATLEENVARLTNERDAARNEVKQIAASGGATAAAPASKDGASGGQSSPFSAIAKAFQTEEGRKAFRSSLDIQTQAQYSGLARALKLNPDEAAVVMSLLGDRNAKLAEDGFKMMAEGNVDDAALNQASEKSKAVREDFDQKLKSVLGEEKFSQLQDYDKTLGDRMSLAQFIEPSFNAAGESLTPDQRDGLLQIMADQRKSMAAPVFDTSGANQAGNLKALQDDSAMQKWFDQEKDFQSRVLQQAPAVLSPGQVNALQKGFETAAQMQKVGMQMGKSMFKQSGGAPPVKVIISGPPK